MKKLFIVANWKCNKTVGEAEAWLNEIQTDLANLSNLTNLEIVLCPPFTLLPLLATKLQSYKATKLKLGAQDVSPFPEGAYTGEISARMLKDLGVEYVLVGHSERRRYFGETDDQVVQKVRMALDLQIMPIICISEFQQFISIFNKIDNTELDKVIFMYEPPNAISVQVGPIGQGEAAGVKEVVEQIKKMKELASGNKFFYGGSVKSDNVADFLVQPEIDGVVPGTASQNAQEFIKIIKNAV